MRLQNGRAAPHRAGGALTPLGGAPARTPGCRLVLPVRPPWGRLYAPPPVAPATAVATGTGCIPAALVLGCWARLARGVEAAAHSPARLAPGPRRPGPVLLPGCPFPVVLVPLGCL
jgi:hypothetical protein